MDIPFHEKLPQLKEYDMIVDGIFGFSFAGEIREPFQSIITVFFINKKGNGKSRSTYSID